jgi:ketosteroid isomerase-like protein/kynurenine formamidase
VTDAEVTVRTVIEAYFDRINNEDHEGLLDLFAADAELRSPTNRVRRGRAELAAYYQAALAPFPEHRDEPVRITVSGRFATVDIHYEGRLANGRTMVFDALNVYEIVGGKILRLDQWYDTHRVRRMLIAAQAATGPESPGGEPPRLGSLAQATPSRLLDALGLVRRGTAFRLDLPLDQPNPPLGARQRMEHSVYAYPGLEHEFDEVLDGFNTQRSSHWDALRHCLRPDGRGYGGRAPEDLGIDLWAEGICGRAVLVDLSVGLDLAWDVHREVTPAEIEGCAASQGVELRPGDVLLLRTGWLAALLAVPPDQRPARLPGPGLAAGEACAAWLREMRFAAVAADNPGLEASPIPSELGMLHVPMLQDLGLAVGELFWLEDLAADSAATGVWDGLFVSVPLNLPGGCASPANALVIR